VLFDVQSALAFCPGTKIGRYTPRVPTPGGGGPPAHVNPTACNTAQVVAPSHQPTTTPPTPPAPAPRAKREARRAAVVGGGTKSRSSTGGPMWCVPINRPP